MLHAGVEGDAEKFAEFIELHAAANDERAAGFADDVGRGGAVFFADFADDFFDQIFDGDDTGHQTVFVDDDGHLLAFALHVFEQLGTEFCFGNKKSGAHQLADFAVGRLAVVDGEHVASHDDAGDVVERFAEDREAGKFGFNDELAQLFERG